MAEYQIVCRRLSSDQRRIERVGLKSPNNPRNEYEQLITTEEANDMIGRGNRCFFVNERGDKVYVSEFGRDFIRTNPDNARHNNLRELPNCG